MNVEGTILFCISTDSGIYKFNDDWLFIGYKCPNIQKYSHLSLKNNHMATLDHTTVYFLCSHTQIAQKCLTNSSTSDSDLASCTDLRKFFIYLHLKEKMSKKFYPSVLNLNQVSSCVELFMHSPLYLALLSRTAVLPSDAPPICQCGQSVVFNVTGLCFPEMSSIIFPESLIVGFLTPTVDGRVAIVDQTGVLQCHICPKAQADSGSHIPVYSHLCSSDCLKNQIGLNRCPYVQFYDFGSIVAFDDFCMEQGELYSPTFLLFSMENTFLLHSSLQFEVGGKYCRYLVLVGIKQLTHVVSGPANGCTFTAKVETLDYVEMCENCKDISPRKINISVINFCGFSCVNFVHLHVGGVYTLSVFDVCGSVPALGRSVLFDPQRMTIRRTFAFDYSLPKPLEVENVSLEGKFRLESVTGVVHKVDDYLFIYSINYPEIRLKLFYNGDDLLLGGQYVFYKLSVDVCGLYFDEISSYQLISMLYLSPRLVRSKTYQKHLKVTEFNDSGTVVVRVTKLHTASLTVKCSRCGRGPIELYRERGCSSADQLIAELCIAVADGSGSMDVTVIDEDVRRLLGLSTVEWRRVLSSVRNSGNLAVVGTDCLPFWLMSSWKWLQGRNFVMRLRYVGIPVRRRRCGFANNGFNIKMTSVLLADSILLDEFNYFL